MLVGSLVKLNLLLAKQSSRKLSQVFTIETRGSVPRLSELSYYELLLIPFNEAMELPEEEVAMAHRSTISPIKDHVHAINPVAKAKLISGQEYFRLIPVEYKESLKIPGSKLAALADESLIHYTAAATEASDSFGTGKTSGDDGYVYQNKQADDDDDDSDVFDDFFNSKKTSKPKPIEEANPETKPENESKYQEPEFVDDFKPSPPKTGSDWDTRLFPGESSTIHSAPSESINLDWKDPSPSYDSYSGGGDYGVGDFSD